MIKIVFMDRSGSRDDYIYVMNTKTQEAIENMKAVAEYLMDYTFPMVSFEDEQKILCMKQRTLTIDGYEIVVCYSMANYEKYVLDTLQIQSPQVPFLPFNIVCKVAQLFLGKENLCYIDFFKYNKKVYCWAVKSFEGIRLPPSKKSDPTSYEGFDFHLMQPGTVDLF